MSVISVAYEEFQSSHQSFRSEGGPWVGSVERGGGEGECSSQKDAWCDGYCLTCAIFPKESRREYHTTITTDISVRMDRYGGANSLDYNWTFWPLYTGTNITAGTTFPLHTQIGTSGYDDNLPAVDYSRFFAAGSEHLWDPSPRISHSGSTTVARSSDGTLGYIPIIITFTMKPATDYEFLNYYIKGIDFQITTPVQTVIITTTSASSVSASSSGSTPSSTLTSGTHIPSSPSSPPSFLGSVSGTDSALPPNSTSESTISSEPPSRPSSISTPAAVGAAVGGAVFVTLLLIALFLWMKKKRKPPAPLVAHPYDMIMHPFETNSGGPGSLHVRNSMQTGSALTSYTHQTSTADIDQSPAAVGRNTTLRQSTYTGTQSEHRPTSDASEMPFDPPPIYGTAQSDRGYDTMLVLNPELAEFANANRTMISEDLEARLTTAGYMPTDDPDGLTEEEWSEHGITKLELLL